MDYSRIAILPHTPIRSSVNFIEDLRMSDLVTIQNGTPVTSTLAIAEGTKVQHKNVLELVRAYLADLERFGEVAFETRNSSFATNDASVERSNQGRPTEYAILNERQSTLLISYMRNTKIVRDFKIRLVERFYEMAEQLKAQAKPLLPEEILVQQAQALLEQKREILRLEAQQQALEAEVKQTNQRLDQIETGIDHFTVIGYARTFLKQSLPLKEAAKLGRLATKVCSDM